MNLPLILFHGLQMYSTSCHSFQFPGDQACLQSNATPSGESSLAELVELVPAIACSFVTTAYISQAEFGIDDISKTDGVRVNASSLLLSYYIANFRADRIYIDIPVSYPNDVSHNTTRFPQKRITGSSAQLVPGAGVLSILLRPSAPRS
ncbi:hypothetical protein F5Y05DRAFT_135517 [Hypoxylon sp. FL0543]|nr:hypothetical protein F5Y05DRAFT_135517 [Hypoxylon sp. FL0543]